MAARDLPAIARQRMRTQRLVGTPFATPADAVRQLCAVQAQDYAGAKWALGQRSRACTDAEVERACDQGEILRTHVLRPTWHFVLPGDLRWLLALTAPRVRATLAGYDRTLEIDRALLRRSHAVLERVLRDGVQLTRTELGQRLTRAGIAAKGQRLGHLVMHAELDAMVCSGARRGKHSTYALVDERAPAQAQALPRDEALAELVRRYFTGHGPALVADLVWWSSLPQRDIQRGVEIAGTQLESEVIAGRTYLQAPGAAGARATRRKGPSIHLLPNYDEQLIAYRERSAALDLSVRAAADPREEVFAHQIVRDGRVIGSWRRVQDGKTLVVKTRLRTRLDAAERAALNAAAAHYARFLQAPVRVA